MVTKLFSRSFPLWVWWGFFSPPFPLPFFFYFLSLIKKKKWRKIFRLQTVELMLEPGTWDFGRGCEKPPGGAGAGVGCGGDDAAMQPDPAREPLGLPPTGRAGDAPGSGKVCAALRVCCCLD